MCLAKTLHDGEDFAGEIRFSTFLLLTNIIAATAHDGRTWRMAEISFREDTNRGKGSYN